MVYLQSDNNSYVSNRTIICTGRALQGNRCDLWESMNESSDSITVSSLVHPSKWFVANVPKSKRNQNGFFHSFFVTHFGSIVTTAMFQFLLVVLTKTTFYDISTDFPPDFCAIVMLATIGQGYLKYCPWQYVQVQDKVQDKVKDKVQDQVQGMEKFSIGDDIVIYSFQHWYKTTQFHRKCILCVSWNLRDPRLSCHLKRQG